MNLASELMLPLCVVRHEAGLYRLVRIFLSFFARRGVGGLACEA